ncbi:MAG: zinc-ribbon domain-containing protein [Bacteroidales bacterium]
MNDTIQQLKQIAVSKGGLCLSDKYVNSQTKMLWQCEYGHKWEATGNNIKKGTWCKECSTRERGVKRRTSIDYFKQYAISKGGICLTDKYENQKTRLTFQCSQGHKWTTSGGTLKGNQTWCRYCANPSLADTPKLKQQRLLELQKTAEARGGILLSTEYINTKTKYKFQCASGHTWATSVGVIRGGSWCKKCAAKIVSDSQRDNLQTFIDIAISKGGKCLSTEYINATNQLRFECSEGHQWWGRPGGIKKGTWCRKCYGTAKSDIEEMKSIATARGGYCLSLEYVTDAVKLKWQCCEGHIWEASPNNIKHDKWCPTCSEGLGERICRLFFQRYFGFDFIKVRPQWLKNSKGFLLELDGYCEELNLAFEHQGRQHYSEVSFFSKRISYDEEKRQLCKQHGVTLIEIPEILNDTKIKDLKPFIIQECKKNNVELPANINEIEITPFEIFTFTKNQERRLLAQRAEAKIILQGGSLLETHLSDKGISFKVVCANNHHWSITNTNLFRDKCCPYCKRETVISLQFAKQEIAKQKALERKQLRAGKELKRNLSAQKLEPRKLQAAILNSKPKIDRRQLSIEKMLAVANSKGGECLSPNYIKDTTPLLWKCKESHTWEATPNSIKAGCWCPSCATNNQWSFADIIEIIEKRNGKCFSNSYINNYSKLDIQCEHGHKFTTTVKSIKIGGWCPQCAIDERAKKKRLSIDDMNVLAKRKHGKCLSVSYTNSTTKLLWGCKNGHQFYSRPGNVQTGYWCPTCSLNKVIDKASDERVKQIEQILATKQGTVFFLDEKANRKSEATWQCKNGHTWKTRIGNVLDGHWCPRCSNSVNWNSKKTSIAEIKKLAQSKGGDCLSTTYDNSNTKLNFICRRGHTWTALWRNIKHKGSWCPKCAATQRWVDRRQLELLLT